MANPLLLAQAGLNLLGSIGSYHAAKAQAAITRAQGRVTEAVGKANSDATLIAGEYNAQVIRNNGIGKANQKRFENSALSSNKKSILIKAGAELKSIRRQSKSDIAREQVGNTQLSSDVIRSMELDAFSKIATQNMDTAVELQNIDAQLSENERIAKLEQKYADMNADRVLAASSNDAFYQKLSGTNSRINSNLRADQMKLQARSDLVGGFATSAGQAGKSGYFG